jgi:hypothetical protein
MKFSQLQRVFDLDDQADLAQITRGAGAGTPISHDDSSPDVLCSRLH